MTDKISDTYANHAITLLVGDKLHRLVAMLCDTYYDDVTETRIAELQETVRSWRWMDADGKRL